MFFSPWRPQSPTNSILSDPKITPMPLNLLGSPARSWEKWAACSSVHRCIINQRALYPFLAPPSPLTTSAHPSDRPARRPQRGRDENFHHFPPPQPTIKSRHSLLKTEGAPQRHAHCPSSLAWGSSGGVSISVRCTVSRVFAG